MGSESSQSLWINCSSKGLKWTEEYDELPVDGVWLRSEMLRCSPSDSDVISNQDLLKLLNHTKREGLLELLEEELITLTQCLSTETTGKFYKHMVYLTVGGRRLQLAVKFHRGRLEVESDYKNLFPLDKLYSQGAKHGYLQKELTKFKAFTWKELRQTISTHSHAPPPVVEGKRDSLESSMELDPAKPPEQQQDRQNKEVPKQIRVPPLVKFGAMSVISCVFLGAIGKLRSNNIVMALELSAALTVALSIEGQQQAVQ